MQDYRLSLDIGTNSIGWCAYALEMNGGPHRPVSVIATGARVFPDGRHPKTGVSNAEMRRLARSMRRNHDRFVARRARLIAALADAGLLPTEPEALREVTALDPYALRVRGLTERLSLHEFGRALFHLNQRRGFKSNRKGAAKDDEQGAIKSALREQHRKMDEAQATTFGEYLYRRREAGESTRARLGVRAPEDPNSRKKEEAFYDFYPDRTLIEDEFKRLWAVQERHHPDILTPEVRNRVWRAIFFQRDLKPPAVGRCTFERDEERAPRALPLSQRLRIYQELNHLNLLDARTLKARPLEIGERDTIALLLCQPKGIQKGKTEVTFKKIKQVLKVGDAVFTIESDKRTGLEPDTVSALLSHKTRFGTAWHNFGDDEQEAIVRALMDEADEEKLVGWLMAEWGLDREHAESVADTPLPQGHGRLGITASQKVLAQLVEEVIPYSEAVQRAGYESHSLFATGEARARLPYYGEVLERHVVPHPTRQGDPRAPLEQRYGKVTNPTVHIALNQLRRVVNEIVKAMGPPAEIHVEVLRDLKNSLRKKKEIQAEQAKNQALNDECARRLREDFKERVSRENIQRLRLWDELGGKAAICVYTGEPINAGILFSKAVEIDHILPWAKTLDDSIANKILCHRRANAQKTNQSPFEAWGHSEAWAEILARSTVLPQNKQRRFSEDALERYAEENDFLARHLTDSQYIARLARAYLAVLFPNGQDHKVVCLPGRLTYLFRHQLGLDSILDEINPARGETEATRGEKNRNDHRHHAVDALVVGLMDRGFLRKAATINARQEEQGVTRLLEGFDDPWPGFRAEAREALRRMVVSHKPDHGIEGALHNDNPYGMLEDGADPRGNAIHYVPASSIDTENLRSIKGKHLRAELFAALSGLPFAAAFKKLAELDDNKRKGKDSLLALCGGDAKAVAARARAFFEARGIRRVRLIETVGLVPIRDRRSGKAYKGVKTDGNAYYEIFERPDGKWEGRIVSTFDANQRRAGHAVEAAPPGRPLIRLFNRDMIEIEHNGARRICFIQKLSDRQIALAEHFESNADARTRDKDDPFRFIYKGSAEALRKSAARFLVVTPGGRVRYLSDPPDDRADS